MSALVPVLLSGGAGARMWPWSREHYPKQLLALIGGQTLLQQAAGRVVGLPGLAPAVVVCHEEHRFLIAEQLRQLGPSPGAMILEPVGRNTAPALTVAALHLAEADPHAVMLVLPADHVVAEPEAFQAAVRAALPHAAAGKLVTFGVTPHTATTRYGYIRCGEALDGDAFAVAAFVEKPDADRAAAFVASGAYLWNSGLFLMTAGAWLEEIARGRPEILSACEQALWRSRRDADFTRLDAESFAACPSDSIDYAAMETTLRGVVVPLAATWADVGDWSDLWSILPNDAAGNLVRGDVLTHDVADSLVFADHRLVATVGVRDLVIVETADAVLVAHKDRSDDVKELVRALKLQDRPEAVSHRRVYRPWGSYETVDRGARFQVKRLTVAPHAALSLQLHRQRAEHWVVVKGRARVTRGDEVFELEENQSTYIPIGVRHRLENPGPEPLEMIEVQSGAYLGEDDIQRFEDRYRRGPDRS